MHIELDQHVLRMPEPSDLEALYEQKNDPENARMLGGFGRGYSRSDLQGWLEYHRGRGDEVLWVIARKLDDVPVGHVGLYQIDHRIRQAEFAILLGDPSARGKGLGRACTLAALDHGFQQLNLNRMSLQVLATNDRAFALYRDVGFQEEGRLRQAQYKDGRYIDVILMSMLREEWERDAS